MKTTLNLLLFASLLIALTFSCKKEEGTSASSSSPTSGDTYYMTVKKDGVEFKTTSAPLVSYGADITIYYNITGFDEAGNRIILNLESPTATGTFPMGTDDAAIHQVSGVYSSIATTNNIWSTRMRPGAGTITISQNTTTNIKGTFSFTGINFNDSTVRVFTEGKFNAKKL